MGILINFKQIGIAIPEGNGRIWPAKRLFRTEIALGWHIFWITLESLDKQLS